MSQKEENVRYKWDVVEKKEDCFMRIVIIDDDLLVTGALKTILEADDDVTVAGTGQDGGEALGLYRKYLPDVLLMDIRMQEVSGLEAAEQIMREYPEAKILLLTTFADDEYIVKALKYGVKGYLLKQDYASILPAIRGSVPGRQYLGRRSSRRSRSFCRRRRRLTGRHMRSARRR